MTGKIRLKVGVLIISNGKLLLIKEKSSYDNQYHWNIIKGTYEPEKDSNLIKAIHREAEEEAGVIVKNVKLFNIFEVGKGGKSIIQFNFLASLKSKKPRLAPKYIQEKRNEDIIEIKLFDKKALQKMKRKDFINERAYLTVQDWLTGGKEVYRLLAQ